MIPPHLEAKKMLQDKINELTGVRDSVHEWADAYQAQANAQRENAQALSRRIIELERARDLL